MPNGSGSRRSSFEAFLAGWLVRQEHYLNDLVSRILAHYQEYCEEKSRIAQLNVFLVFSPTWFTSLERTFLWIAGFKPALAFRLVANSVNDLSEDQRWRMDRLMEETKVKERALNHALAKIQESVAAPVPLLEILRRGRRSVDGEIREEDKVFAAWKSASESVVANADALRTNTAVKVVEILSPAQSVRFLAAAAQLQLRIRTWGLQREAEIQESRGNG